MLHFDNERIPSVDKVRQTCVVGLGRYMLRLNQMLGINALLLGALMIELEEILQA